MLLPPPSFLPTPPLGGAILDQGQGQQDGSSRRAHTSHVTPEAQSTPVCENLLGGLRAWRGASRGCGVGTKSPWGEGLPWGKQVVIVIKAVYQHFPWNSEKAHAWAYG